MTTHTDSSREYWRVNRNTSSPFAHLQVRKDSPEIEDPCGGVKAFAAQGRIEPKDIIHGLRNDPSLDKCPHPLPSSYGVLIQKNPHGLPHGYTAHPVGFHEFRFGRNF